MSLLGDIVGVANLGYQIAKDRHLTGAQREANQFSHDEAQLAFERTLSADSTKYQRQVSDMRAAGLNPMMAVSSGAGSVQSPSATGVQPSGGDVSGALGFLLQSKLLESQIKNIDADTKKKESETTGIDIQNDINEATSSAKKEAAELENSLTRSRISLIDKQLDEISASIEKQKQEAKTEEERRSLMAAERVLASANAKQIVQMLPYSKKLAEAQTEEAKQAALLSAAHTAYQNHLIDDGYLDAFIRNAVSTADKAEADAAVTQMRAAIRTGDYSKTGEFVTDSVARDFMQDITILLDNLNPLRNLFK